MLRSQALWAYKERGFEKVEGWCSNALFPIVDFLNSLPFNQGGGVCEIGVHHGKFFLLLNQVTQKDDRSFAVDVFEDQFLNIDCSGCASIGAFKKNLELYDIHRGQNTTIVQCDSTDSKQAGELVERIGRGTIRFFSIDGGHTPQHTVNDLVLANLLLRNSGVVILDDILNHHWLGVLEGTFKYLLGDPTLVPFAIGHNKLFFCKLSYYDQYFRAFDQFAMKTKIVSLLGHKLVAL